MHESGTIQTEFREDLVMRIGLAANYHSRSVSFKPMYMSAPKYVESGLIFQNHVDAY